MIAELYRLYGPTIETSVDSSVHPASNGAEDDTRGSEVQAAGKIYGMRVDAQLSLAGLVVRRALDHTQTPGPTVPP